MQLWFCPVLAFLLGSIPFGLFIAKAKGIDIRQHGSGNIGATNVFRVVGKKYGLTCLLLDALKGFIPVVIAVNLVPVEGRDSFHLSLLESFAMNPVADQFTAQLVHVITALAAVLGHNYSPWIGFKGGKGIATSAGVLIGLMPPGVLLILIFIFIVVLRLTRYVALASITAAICLPVVMHLGARYHENEAGISLWEAGTWNKPLFFFTVIIAFMAVLKHRSNIRRLLDGTESKFGLKNKPLTKES